MAQEETVEQRLERIMHDTSLHHKFRWFALKRLAHENFFFYETVLAYKSMMKKPNPKGIALGRFIISQFFSDSGKLFLYLGNNQTESDFTANAFDNVVLHVFNNGLLSLVKEFEKEAFGKLDKKGLNAEIQVIRDEFSSSAYVCYDWKKKQTYPDTLRYDKKLNEYFDTIDTQ